MTTTNIVLGYWNTRGLGEALRMMLEYAGQPFENRLYEMSTDAEHKKRDWATDKTSLAELVGGDGEAGLPFPNLPYYIETRADGSKLKLTQSISIARHLARKFGLAVRDDLDRQATLDMLEQQVVDLRTNIVGYAYESSMVLRRMPNYPLDCLASLQQWEPVLAGKRWLLGDQLTHVDFLLFEALDFHRLLNATLFDQLPNASQFMQRFRDLPQIKHYMQSPRYRQWPLTSPFAKNFGFHKE